MGAGSDANVLIWRRDRCMEGHYLLGLLFTSATAVFQ